MDMEEWKAIPGFEGIYEASTLGRIRSVDRIERDRPLPRKGKVLATYRQAGKHTHVTLYLHGKRIMCKVHRLVLLTFSGEPESGQEGDHINFDRDDNSVTNLRWLSKLENMRHSFKAGRHALGEAKPGSKLNPEKVRKIVEMRKGGRKRSEIAKQFGVSETVIWQIATGRSWRHVTEALTWRAG